MATMTAVALPLQVAPPHQTFEARFDVRETWAHVLLVGGDAALVEDARSRLESLAAMWDPFDPTSDIARLSAADGVPVDVAPETQLLVGLAVQAWQPVGSDGVEVDVTAGTVTIPSGVQLDVSVMAQGLAADLTAQAAIEAGVEGVCVNVGGDLRLMGLSPRSDGWAVDVATPDGSGTLGAIRLFEGAVATATSSTRSSGLVAATVVVEEGWRAEVLAATVLQAGVDATMHLLDDHDAAGLVVRDDGTLLANARWRDLINQ
jgi:FAD:protein FMN transferase